jgi:DNA-binding NarL/FixJ family response regulator
VRTRSAGGRQARRSRSPRRFRFAAKAALGLLAVGTGRVKDAIDLLAPEASRWEASALVEPSMAPFLPDLVEAHVAQGNLREARRWLELFRTAATTANRTWALAACARCDGLLAGPEAFDEAFQHALELLDGGPLSLEQARAQLAYGERLRRDGRKREARGRLRSAHGAFAAASAIPWQARARAELQAAGERMADGPRPLPALSPQELQISVLVAEGKTNKEIAATMYLSPKTIEYHLANAYRKLDIHSRAELARIVGQDAPVADPLRRA